MRLAAIDIGSNAARLLISDILNPGEENLEVIKINLVRVPLRLGFDVFENGKISLEREETLIHTMRAFQLLMQVHRVEYQIVCATSAMRDAKNANEIIKSVFDETKLKINVISGKEEASAIFENHIEQFLDKDHSYLYIDVGGGSTELTLFDNNKPVYQESFDIGTIRLLKDHVDNNEWQRFKNAVKIESKKYKNLQGIGSGGNINKLFSLSKRKEGKPLPTSLLNEYYEEMAKMNTHDRMIKYNLREDRADVILPALLIYTHILKWSSIDEMYVPKIGLADGLIRKLYKDIQGIH